MHTCPHFLHLGVAVDSDTLFYVHLLPAGLKWYLLRTGRTFSQATEGLWKSRVLGEKDTHVPPFRTPSMQLGSLHHEEVMCDGYRPKMLLDALDELFYIFNQVRKQQSAYERS